MKVVSLFSGIGGLDPGFEEAGHEVIQQVERDPHRVQVLQNHFPGRDLHTDVTGIHALPPETELVRDISREFNGLRQGTARPSFFDPTPARKRRVKRVETYENSPCGACGSVDSEEGLVCESCDMVVHLKCMEHALENVPKGDWYCASCRDSFQFSKFGDRTPCARCGVADKNDGPACDRCDAMYHADCLNVTELSRYHSATESRNVWYCECCHDHAKRDKELSLRTEKLWEGIENHNKVFTQDEPSLSECLSASEPSIFAWVKKGQVQTRYALYLPSSHPDVIFEVLHVTSVPLFSLSPSCALESVYLLTGNFFDMPNSSRLSPQFGPLKAHVGFVENWSLPQGCSALVPMLVHFSTMSLVDVPTDLLQGSHRVEEEFESKRGLGVCETYSGLGCWLDGAQRCGKLGIGVGVESDADVAKVFQGYAQRYAEVAHTKVENLAGIQQEFCPRQSAAEHVLKTFSQHPLDCLTGSPLCEGFARLNMHPKNANATQKRMHLRNWGQTVLKFRPRYAMMENLPELVAGRNEPHLCALNLLLAMHGYQLQSYIVTCSAFGAASSRTRFVLVATRTGVPVPPPPKPTHDCAEGVDGHAGFKGVRWALSEKKQGAYMGEDLHLLPTVSVRNVFEKLGEPTASPRDASGEGHLHAERLESNITRALLDALPEGNDACYAAISKKVRKRYSIERGEHDLANGGSKCARLMFRRLELDQPAPSFTKQFRPDGFQGRVVHPCESRVCTPAEALACLGFEVDRLPFAKLSVGHKIAGNAFSPLVTQALFEAICTPWKNRPVFGGLSLITDQSSRET